MCAVRLSRKLRSMNTSAADRLAARLDRLPRGARAGLLSVSIAAAFALVGTGAQASPIKGAPAGPAVTLDPDSGPVYESVPMYSVAKFSFSSDAADELQCSLDDSSFEKCASPVELTVTPGSHVFRVRAVDRAGVGGAPAA